MPFITKSWSFAQRLVENSERKLPAVGGSGGL